MSALIQKIKILSQNPKKNTKNYELTEKTKAGIHEIFLFYSKQQFLLGKAPTFDSIYQKFRSSDNQQIFVILQRFWTHKKQ